jgi:BirA family transcriptional regulator, biotin operon repressor / biotin---[acetyl-CoA-carboxylase] ligase
VTSPSFTTIQWPAEAIWEAVAPSLPGFTVELLPEIDSTNSELMRRFRGSPGAPQRPEPVLLLAEQQSAGRGRLGRSWQSRRGDSLTFSLGLTLQPADWSGLSLVVGISLAESLDPGGSAHAGRSRIGLKWPNDLWLQGEKGVQGERKLGGILVETASVDGVNGVKGLRYVVIGVGLNIKPLQLAAAAAPASPAGSAVAPGCLQDLFPELDAPAALLRVLAPLVQALQGFEQFGFAPFQARFAARDVLSGRAVQLSDGSQGTAHGVGESGGLRVQTAAGMKEITSAEVSVRPLAAGTAAAAAPKDAGPC